VDKNLQKLGLRLFLLGIVAAFCGLLIQEAGFWPLLFLAFSILFFAVFNSKTRAEAVCAGFVFGAVFAFAVLSPYLAIAPLDWLEIEGGLFVVVAAGVIKSSIIGLIFALTSWYAWDFSKKLPFWQLAIVSGAIWVVGEFALSYFWGILFWSPQALSVTPWTIFSLGQLFISSPALSQLASVGGIWLLSFLLVFVGALGGLVFANLKGKNRIFGPLLLALTIFVVWFGLGSLIRGGREAQIKSAKNIAITTVQTGKKDSQFDLRLRSLLVSAIWQNSQLIVVGEVFKNPPKDLFLLPVWGKLGPKMPLVIGESVYRESGQKINQLVAWRFGKGIVASAWKSSIVPFGEHLPWLFGGVLQVLGQNNYLEKYKNSRQVAAGGGQSFNILADGVRVGALACGAFITASGSRSLVSQDAQIVVAPASWQVFHQDQTALEMATGYLKMRSIELGKPIVQAAHEGENFVAYPDGSVNRSGILGDRVLNFNVAILDGVTIYHRFGAWVVAVAAAYLLGFVLLKRKKF